MITDAVDLLDLLSRIFLVAAVANKYNVTVFVSLCKITAVVFLPAGFYVSSSHLTFMIFCFSFYCVCVCVCFGC